MKIKWFITFLIFNLLIGTTVFAQIGNEFKSQRNKKGMTVTMLTPSLYSLYKKSNLSAAAEEELKKISEINVIEITINEADEKEIVQFTHKMNSILENEAKYNLVKSHSISFASERLYVTENNDKITSLVLWNENPSKISIIELKGDINLSKVDQINNVLNVKGLEYLAYINMPSDTDTFADFFGGGGIDNIFEQLRSNFGFRRDSIDIDDFFGGGFDIFGGNIFEKMEEMMQNFGMGSSSFSQQFGDGSSSSSLEVITENGKTRFNVNTENSTVIYVLNGKRYELNELEDGITGEILNVTLLHLNGNMDESYIVVNTKEKMGEFISFSDGVLKYKYNNQEYTVNPEKLSDPSLIINNSISRRFNIDPADIIQIRPATELERELFNSPLIQTVIVTESRFNFFF